ncbi:MAG: DUF3316 domain-containing protein [Muribaculaceae bacterium]|nr:DUF3316 domain-containing protein [Muribaculaceae bacterium]
MRHIRILLYAILLISLSGRAQEADPIVLETTYTVEVGAERAFNTYLSPLLQTGWTVGLAGEWSRPMGHSDIWGQQIGARARLGVMTNPAGNAYMDDVQADLSWCAIQGFKPMRGLTLGVGAGALLQGGVLYVPRNSNNPVAARAYVGATLEGRAVYSFKLFGTPLRLIEAVSLPSLGVFFSPHFGQSYYEIYLGETHGLARCGWWGNRFAINNHVALEIPVCSTRLRLGYRFEVANSIASGIDSRVTTHTFTLGISTDWINVTKHHE